MSRPLHVYKKKHEKPTNAVDLTGISTQEQSGRRWNFSLDGARLAIPWPGDLGVVC
jgi:hypothetical protein